jgi:hypothetical protein
MPYVVIRHYKESTKLIDELERRLRSSQPRLLKAPTALGTSGGGEALLIGDADSHLPIARPTPGRDGSRRPATLGDVGNRPSHLHFAGDVEVPNVGGPSQSSAKRAATSAVSGSSELAMASS